MQAVLAGEDHVVRGERAAVGPDDVLAELPGDAAEIARDPAVLDRGDLVDEHRHHVAVLVVVGERLDHERRCFDLLGAAGEIGVHGRGRLPVQDVQVTVAAALGMGGRRHHCRHRQRRDQGGDVFHFPLFLFGWWVEDGHEAGTGSDSRSPFRAALMLLLNSRRRGTKNAVRRARHSSPRSGVSLRLPPGPS